MRNLPILRPSVSRNVWQIPLRRKMRPNRTMRKLKSIALVLVFLVTDTDAAETPWWSERWTARQEVVSTGQWVRVLYGRALAQGRFVDPQSQLEVPHWSQTIELSEPRSIAVDPKVHYGFPRLIEAKDGRLLLFYRVGTSHAKDSSTIAMRTSLDEGASWGGASHSSRSR